MLNLYKLKRNGIIDQNNSSQTLQYNDTFCHYKKAIVNNRMSYELPKNIGASPKFFNQQDTVLNIQNPKTGESFARSIVEMSSGRMGTLKFKSDKRQFNSNHKRKPTHFIFDQEKLIHDIDSFDINLDLKKPFNIQ